MPSSSKKPSIFKFKKSYIPVIGVVLLILLAIFMLWFNNVNRSMIQAAESLRPIVGFEGEYRIGNGEWQPLGDGKHISSTKGNVTLKGKFFLLSPDGKERVPDVASALVAFYTNHIAISFNGVDFLENENPIFGDSSCGESWYAYEMPIESANPIEITIHNPHGFGNENAVDELLSGFAIWDDMEFEKSVLKSGEVQRIAGI